MTGGVVRRANSDRDLGSGLDFLIIVEKREPVKLVERFW